MGRYSTLFLALIATIYSCCAQDAVYQQITVKYDPEKNVIHYGDKQFVALENVALLVDEQPLDDPVVAEDMVEEDNGLTEDGRYKPGTYNFWLC